MGRQFSRLLLLLFEKKWGNCLINYKKKRKKFEKFSFWERISRSTSYYIFYKLDGDGRGNLSVFYSFNSSRGALFHNVFFFFFLTRTCNLERRNERETKGEMVCVFLTFTMWSRRRLLLTFYASYVGKLLPKQIKRDYNKSEGGDRVSQNDFARLSVNHSVCRHRIKLV